MSTFELKIVATNKVFYEGGCIMLIVPGLDGEVAVMAHHQNMVVATKEGHIRFQTEDGEWHKAVVGIGFVHIVRNHVTMVVDTAESPEEIDAVRAGEALERAREQLRQKQSVQEYHISKASLARALSRLKETEKHEI